MLPEDNAWCGFPKGKNEDWPLLKPCCDAIGMELNSARNCTGNPRLSNNDDVR